MDDRICQVDGCERRIRCRGLCPLHYSRWIYQGDPLWTPLTSADRFWAKVDKNGPIPERWPDLGRCWIWTASRNPGGYGKFGSNRLAHRVSYEMRNGAIPQGWPLDHLCRTRACVNPDHLEVVTMRENLIRGEGPTFVIYRSGKCAKGHDRATYGKRRTDRVDSYRCSECERLYGLESYRRHKDKITAKKRAQRAANRLAKEAANEAPAPVRAAYGYRG